MTDKEKVQLMMADIRRIHHLRRDAMISEGIIPYTHEAVVAVCRELLGIYETADDAGTFDFAVSRVQDFFYRLEPILNEDGGI